jgi:CheY-like chemotaxis protein
LAFSLFKRLLIFDFCESVLPIWGLATRGLRLVSILQQLTIRVEDADLTKGGMAKMTQAVVIDDNKDDLFIATRILHKLGIEDVLQFSRIPDAVHYLEDIAEDIRPCPGLIVLDLNVGHDSGFEVLRLYKSNPKLQACDIIVWTGSGAVEKELCEHFGVECVQKRAGDSSLMKAISSLLKKKKSIHHDSANDAV